MSSATSTQMNIRTVTPSDQITFSCATEGASIYYTTNGDCPCDDMSENRKLYEGPIQFSENVNELRVRAMKDGLVMSENVTIHLTVADEPVTKRTVSFNSNGGSGSMVSIQVDDGTSYTLPKCTFTAPSGKVFDKWDKGTVGTKITVSSNVTLKAQWKDAPTPTPDPAPAPDPTPAVEGVPMQRLYNPNSGEHFYTANIGERDMLVGVGWNSEGEGWTAPVSSATPVYRMYNANGGEHHYTMSEAEKDMLVSVGWNYEGIGWHSDDQKRVPLFRDYNPNAFANNHNYTVDESEHEWLLSLGWRDEGLAWYGM